MNKFNKFRKIIIQKKKTCGTTDEANADFRKFIDSTKTKELFLDNSVSKSISALPIIEVALNDTEFREYFVDLVRKFQFIINFPNKEKLGEFTKINLGNMFKLLNSDFVNAAYEKKMLTIMNCNMGEDDFYTEQKHCTDLDNSSSSRTELFTKKV